MLIGEAPGSKEDELGIPFVGRSGKLLDQLLESVGFNTESDVYICNLIKCRPPNNRRPSKSELAACRSWLDRQIKLVNPNVIALAGSTSVAAVLETSESITKIRGEWRLWKGRWVMPLFHPAYLLRNPSVKEESPKSLTRSDLIEVRNKINTYDCSIGISAFNTERRDSQ